MDSASFTASGLRSMTINSAGVQRLEHLNTDVAQPACADDDALSRGQPPGSLRRGVVGGEARVGKCGDVGRLERVVDLHHAARRRLQVVGVPAVGVDAREVVRLAVHVVAGPAGAAQPAGDQRMHDHLVALGDVGDRRADRVHPAGVLVADRVRQLDLGLLGPLALEDVQVGAAHPGAADLDDDVERAGRSRSGTSAISRFL